MNTDLLTKLSDRFTIEELAGICGITYPMFAEAFSNEILESLDALADIDQAFNTDLDEDADEL